MEKIRIKETVIVEGKYDKIKLASVIDAHIIPVGGFSLFNNGEKMALIRKLSEKGGIIILTDSDPAGFVIRNKLKGMLPEDADVKHLYVPAEKGKEKRKKEESKAGLLGVEGIESERLRKIFSAYAAKESENKNVNDDYTAITKAQLYAMGLSGGEGSREKRDALCKVFDLPAGMSANAFLEALTILRIRKEELESKCGRLLAHDSAIC